MQPDRWFGNWFGGYFGNWFGRQASTSAFKKSRTYVIQAERRTLAVGKNGRK